MKAAGAPQKLRFTVQSCSGEDSDYPARELLYHSPQTRGWQSPRFCKFPQEIVLRLERPSKVQQIQILSHEYKIPTKIEVYVSAAAEDPAAAKRLGYLSFDSNERSSHQARELKSVHVNVHAYVVRLVIHRCHVNKLNIYNQVGIVALNLIGDPLPSPPDGPPGFLEVQAPGVTGDDNRSGSFQPQPQPYYNRAAADVADLALDIHVDSVTAGRIRELTRLKEAAVAAEDYDEAKRLKASIERLKVVGTKIAQLEARKCAAVEKEDYDLAKALKADIEKLRLAGEAAALAGGSSTTGDGSSAPRGKNPDEIFNRVLGAGKAGVQGSGFSGPAAFANGSSGHDAGPHDAGPGAAVAEASVAYGSTADVVADGSYVDNNGSYSPEASYGRSTGPGALRHTSSDAGRGQTKHQAYDDRPAVGRGSYAGDEAGAIGGERSSVGGYSAVQHSGTQATAPPPKGWPSDLPVAEALSGANSKDADPVLELSGEYVAAAFFSKNWQLRDAALGHVTELVKSGALDGADKRECGRGLVRLAVKALKDKVPNIFLRALPLYQALLDCMGSGRDLTVAVEQALPVLLEKLGDNNARIRDSARDAIVALAHHKDAGLKGLASQFVKPVKNQTAWRPVLSTLQLLQDLVPQLGIGRSTDGSGGFEVEELMEYLSKAFNSPNAEVRAAAVKVAAAAHELAGVAVRRLLPRDLNPKIKEQLDAAFGVESSAPPPAAQTTPAAAPKARTTTSKPASTSKATPAKGHASHAGNGSAHAANGGGHAGAPGEGDEPAPFEAELRAREKQYGANHPAVAESCSNLAILYNQRGQYNKAQPLYERALRIYESQYGPDHQEVAHTLTDLAVLHLEQGRDGVGRPLLERALAIQENALGPDHPDVLAIRDVLSSE